eukprot:3251560-Prymnesium_polylepis.1
MAMGQGVSIPLGLGGSMALDSGNEGCSFMAAPTHNLSSAPADGNDGEKKAKKWACQECHRAKAA